MSSNSSIVCSLGELRSKSFFNLPSFLCSTFFVDVTVKALLMLITLVDVEGSLVTLIDVKAI